MTATLISLLSIFIGIIGANLSGFLNKNYSFGFIGNTIAGVFGSIFLIKSIGRIGFSPKYIVQVDQINYGLFTLNMFISFIGGFLAVIVIYKIKMRMHPKKLKKIE